MFLLLRARHWTWRGSAATSSKRRRSRTFRSGKRTLTWPSPAPWAKADRCSSSSWRRRSARALCCTTRDRRPNRISWPWNWSKVTSGSAWITAPASSTSSATSASTTDCGTAPRCVSPPIRSIWASTDDPATSSDPAPSIPVTSLSFTYFSSFFFF